MSTNRVKTRRMACTLVRTALLSVCLVLFAVACGQRGPLYLPKPDTTASTAAAPNSEAGNKSDDEAADKGPASDDEDNDEETP